MNSGISYVWADEGRFKSERVRANLDRALVPTVLVADDSPVARHAVASRLGAQVTVVTAASYAEAAHIDATSLDAAVLDLDLGDGDGVTLARDLLAAKASLPIAFFTGEVEGPLVSAARSLGPVFAKTKPADAIAWALAACQKR